MTTSLNNLIGANSASTLTNADIDLADCHVGTRTLMESGGWKNNLMKTFLIAVILVMAVTAFAQWNPPQPYSYFFPSYPDGWVGVGPIPLHPNLGFASDKVFTIFANNAPHSAQKFISASPTSSAFTTVVYKTRCADGAADRPECALLAEDHIAVTDYRCATGTSVGSDGTGYVDCGRDLLYMEANAQAGNAKSYREWWLGSTTGDYFRVLRLNSKGQIIAIQDGSLQNPSWTNTNGLSGRRWMPGGTEMRDSANGTDVVEYRQGGVKLNGVIEYGSVIPVVNPTITGYVTIKDQNGIDRKLAVIQ